MRKPKILIVDDVPKNIQVVANILQTEGYDMAFAQSGRIALDLIAKHTFDLILLDVMMPDMDGFEVCQTLKTMENTQDIPIIFLTAKTESESAVKGFDCGAVDYVTKPFNGAELLARVRTHLALKRTRHELMEANSTKDKFFSIIAHDLKNPFHSLIGLSEILLSGFDAYSDDQKKGLILEMKNTCDHTYKLLKNLLDWARVQTGKIKCTPDVVDLFTIAFENMTLFKTAAETKQISLQSDIPKNTMAFADGNMLTMVVRNLVSNAIKFTNPGGIVRISCQSSDSMLEVIVSDSGVGIKEDNIKKLFRLDAHYTTPGTSKEQGTGLGLILCNEFVKRNGGVIHVESEYGKGSRFIFSVPKPSQ